MTLTDEQKATNKENRIQAKRAAKQLAAKIAKQNQKPVESITITIEWRKSRMYGFNPHAEAAVSFKDGSFERRGGYTASGCGYDKESTVIAAIFNDFLAYKLYTEIPGEAPYGMYYGRAALEQMPDYVSYNGGVGTSCYYRIGEFIGGKFENLASGKSFDVFKYTDNER